MVFTDAQAITFLTAEPYLGLSLRTATALASEGIIMPGDFAEFDKDGLDAICRNLRKPARQLVGGVLADVEPVVGHDAHHQDHDVDHQRDDRAPDEKVGEALGNHGGGGPGEPGRRVRCWAGAARLRHG